MVGIVVTAVVIASCSGPTQPSNGPNSSGHSATLSPASTPASSHLCRHALMHDADGNVTPLLCEDGDVNTLAWEYYAKLGESPILEAGRAASLQDVERALCVTQDATLQERMSEGVLAAAYYGWRFGDRSTNILNGSGCSEYDK
jgi:hypothetical protein